MIAVVVGAVKAAWAFVLPAIGPALEWALPAWAVLPGADGIKRALRAGAYIAILAGGVYLGVKGHAWITGDKITPQEARAQCDGLISAASIEARERAVTERETRIAQQQEAIASDAAANEAFRKELEDERSKLGDSGSVFADDDGLRAWRRRGY